VHGFRSVLVVAVVTVLLAGGCGGDGMTEAEAIAECERTFAAGYLRSFTAMWESQLDAPEAGARETARLFCAEGARQGIDEIDPDSPEFREAVETLIEEQPELLHPVCEDSALAGFQTLPPELQTEEMRRETARFGRRYCNLVILEGLFSFERPPTQAELVEQADRIHREHPDLLTPTCVLGGMTEYENAPLVVEGVEVAPKRARVYFERFCTEAARSGALSGMTLEPTPAQERQLQQIAELLIEEMVAAGELP
jgi:hypothetical protein